MCGLVVPSISRLARRALLPLTLLTGLSLGVSVGAYSLCLVPAQERLTRAEEAYQTVKQEQATLQTARKTQEQMRVAQRQLEDVWRVLPTQNQFAALAVAISELGRSERVSIPGMSYSLSKAEEGLPAKASLSFKATGEYAAIYRVIHRLETTDPYLVIESLDAARAPKSERSTSTLVVFNVRVATFLRPHVPTAGMS
ncbi:MAG: type 4a pilus biogenesis protein PilO [Nitrospiraceae bacterium]